MTKEAELSEPKSCLSKAHAKEMLFVLLSRDAAAPSVIRFWVKQRLRLGMNNENDDQIVEALNCAVEMERQLQASNTQLR
jgi:hypothetical protein